MEDEKESNPLENQHQLRFMWIAHFEDNTSLPQFDPYNYKENSFQEVLDKEEKIIKFGLYPFPPDLAKELRKNISNVISIPFLPKFEINLDKHKRLINYRECFISQEEFHICRKCGKEFHTNPDLDYIESKYTAPLCPNCNAHDYYKCENCGKKYKKFENATGGGHKCECGGYLEHKQLTSGKLSREKRWINYYLGYQETINNINKKTILKIDEDGNVEMIYE